MPPVQGNRSMHVQLERSACNPYHDELVQQERHALGMAKYRTKYRQPYRGHMHAVSTFHACSTSAATAGSPNGSGLGIRSQHNAVG